MVKDNKKNEVSGETSIQTIPRRTRTVKIEKKNKEGRILATFDYAKVSARVAEFNLSNTNGSIRTKHIAENGWTLFTATIIPDVKNMERIFTGTSLGKLGNEKALEKLETIAVGRALAFAGFLSDGEIASSEEMDKYEETVQLLEESEIIDAVTELESAHNLDELAKIWRKFTPVKRANTEIMRRKEQLKDKYENLPSTTTESGVARSEEGESNGNGTPEDSGNTSGKEKV